MSRWLRAWLHRGEMPDPVDDAYRTAAAALAPDAGFLPPSGRCDCQGCVDTTFTLIMARYGWPHVPKEHR